MINITHSIKNLMLFIGGIGALALAVTVSTPYAQAYEVNILSNQNMTIGSTGETVVVLQSLLQELGFMTIPQNIPMGYFGSVTKNGLARYQTSQGVLPAIGYFGPVTKVAMHQQFLANGWTTLLGW